MLTAFLVAALATVALGGVWVGTAAIARHRAQSAADLAALAVAAQVVAGPSGACGKAELVVGAAGGVLHRCDVLDLDVVVVVVVGIGGPVGGHAQAIARAGPV